MFVPLKKKSINSVKNLIPPPDPPCPDTVIFSPKYLIFGENQFFGRGGGSNFDFLWGTNKMKYVYICHGNPWVSGDGWEMT